MFLCVSAIKPEQVPLAVKKVPDKCGGMFSDDFITNLLHSVTVKEL